MTENTINAAEDFLKQLTSNGDLPWLIKGDKAAELLVEWGQKIAQGESNMLDGQLIYLFWQNNSGGKWVGPDFVAVRATSGGEANRIAQEHGVYFDGVAKGLDCDCCGSRWYPFGETEFEPNGYYIFASEEEFLTKYHSGVEWLVN